MVEKESAKPVVNSKKSLSSRLAEVAAKNNKRGSAPSATVLSPPSRAIKKDKSPSALEVVSKRAPSNRKTAAAAVKAAAEVKSGRESTLVAAASKRISKEPLPPQLSKSAGNRDKVGPVPYLPRKNSFT